MRNELPENEILSTLNLVHDKINTTSNCSVNEQCIEVITCDTSKASSTARTRKYRESNKALLSLKETLNSVQDTNKKIPSASRVFKLQH